MNLCLPQFSCGLQKIDQTFQIACGDVAGNIALFRGGLLPEAESVFLAGKSYSSPWTRDAAFNVWYGGFLAPEVSHNTLLAVLEKDEHGRLLRKIAHSLERPLIHRKISDVLIIQIDSSAVRNHLTCNHIETRSLTCSIRTEESDDFALLNFHGHALDDSPYTIFLNKIFATEFHFPFVLLFHIQIQVFHQIPDFFITCHHGFRLILRHIYFLFDFFSLRRP